MEATEAARGKHFDWLLRLRPDTAFFAPIGHLADLDAGAVHAVFRQSGMADMSDHFAIVPREFAEAYFGIERACPTSGQVLQSECLAELHQGHHIYPECAFKMRLLGLGVRIAAFPKIYQVVRHATCEQSYDLWGGLQKTDRCGTTGN